MSLRLVWVGVVCVGGTACSSDDGSPAATEGSGSSASTADSTVDAGPHTDSTTGASGGATTESATEGSDADTAVDGDTADTGLDTGDGSILAECDVDAPCADLSMYCDYCGCAADYASPDADCVFTALSASWSGTPARVTNLGDGEFAETMTLIALGDGTALVERDFGTPAFAECQLQPASWFDECIGNTDRDDCYWPPSWILADTCTELPPACPTR